MQTTLDYVNLTNELICGYNQAMESTKTMYTLTLQCQSIQCIWDTPAKQGYLDSCKKLLR